MSARLYVAILFLVTSIGLGADSRFYVVSPVVHDQERGIYTAFALTNSALTKAPGAINFEKTSATLILWDERGSFASAWRLSLDYTETLLFHTGDLGLKNFRGCATLDVQGRLTGSVYVVEGAKQYQAKFEEVP